MAKNIVEDKTNTPNEVLDLVDENDRVVGEVRKGEANKNPDFIHREIAVIVYDGEGRVLLQQRSMKKKVDSGLWAVSCAGHVPKGMKPIDAAHMELKEELGFDTDVVFVEKQLDKIPAETRFVYWYVGRYSGQEIVVEPEEVEKTKWVAEKDFVEFLVKNEITKTSKVMVERFWREGLASKV